jgi:hypothetical protein
LKLTPTKKADELIRDHVETNHFFDDSTGDLYDPPTLPPDPAPDDDAEAEE